MSSKRKKGNGESWEKGEEVLQGVILADSFNFKFRPITLEKPRALLPLINCPLLDYTIEFLVEAGVEELFVFCCAHADQIQEHLRKSKWMGPKSSCEVHIIVVEDCLSTGDALREIDRKSLIRSDFVLVSGDVVSNMKLEKVLQEHKVRREKDKSSVMTMVFKVAGPGHRTRCKEDDTVVALDSTSNRIMHLESTKRNKKFSFPLGLFSDNSHLQIRYDLLDCNICICSTQVPQLFTDNFDYQTRHDFIKGILSHEDIMGNQIHCHVISDKYAARVSNLYMYDAISKDIIHRWAYPIVPDNSSFFMEDSYSYIRHNLYMDKNLSLARDCVLEENLIIGSGSSVGTATVISNSVIGKNCIIGDNVRLEGAHLWDNVIVESGCHISSSILCTNVHIKKNVTITAGSLISFNVVVGPDIVLPPGARLSLKQQRDDDGDFGMDELSLEDKDKTEEPIAFNPEEVGKEGAGYLWRVDDDSDEELDKVQDIWGVDQESSSEDEVSSIASDVSSLPESPPPDESRAFYNEVLETIRLGVADGVSPDNIILEINGSKYAWNVTFRDVNQSIGKALLESALHDSNMDKQTQSKNIKQTIKHLKLVLANYVKDADGQTDLINAVEEFFVQNEWAQPVLPGCLSELYQHDILEETVILHWHSHPGSASDDTILDAQRHELRKAAEKFITWLQEAESESEEEED